MSKLNYNPKCLSDVTKKQWSKWTLLQQFTFNDLFYVMLNNQKLFLHPKVIAVDPKLWRTTAHNAAWEAAEAVGDSMKEIRAYKVI
jgi:hypothetical protein